MNQQTRTELSKRIGRSGEDYLEAIGHLCHKNGSAQVSDIAQMLHVKKPSVTAAMRKLADLGLIEYHQYAPITLTREGERYAEQVIYSHTILLRFMTEIAGLAPERADEAACLIEHILTYEEISTLGARLTPPALPPAF
ncbi:MAG: metal-dependent transcriptional regulator [Akkermansia sp.]|nr:metal-dependent transcriptional regulator [Akkermansia sp.]